MTITFYTSKSEKNKIGKDLTTIATKTGTLRERTSILNPVFDVTTISATDIAKINYFYIPDFNRYYFVTGVESVANGVWAISGHVDVLESYKTEIKAQKAVLRRNEKASHYNTYLSDGVFRAYENPYIITKNFPSGFTGESFVLAVAGS